MASSAPTDAPTTDPTQPETPDVEGLAPEPPVEPKMFDAEYVSKLRAEAAKYRTENKDLAEKAKQFDDLQESQKSELQRAQEAAASAQAALAEAQNEALRTKVAAAKGLPAALAERLRGATQEEMEADADSMLAEIEQRYVAKQGASREATGAGVTGKPGIDTMSPRDFVRMTREHRG